MQPFPPLTVSLPQMLDGANDQQFRQAIYRIVQAASRLGDCREGFAREIGLTGNQYLVLMSIAHLQRDEGIGIASVAVHVGLAASHVTTDVGRLVRKGLLRKRPSPVDKRAVLVSLTAEGEATVHKISKVIRVVNDILFQSISREELEQARIVSEKLVRNSERAIAELRLIHTRHQFSPDSFA